MATPANRVPVRIARGSKANLDTAIAAGDLKEGEICYATDENGIYVVESGTLTQAGADLATTSIDALSDVDTTTAAPTDGQVLVWDNANSKWEPGDVSGEIEWTLTANGTTDYIFAGPGFAGTETDPDIYVMRGQTYKFTNGMGAHPFQIQSTQGTSGTAYNDGITNNGVSNGTLTWEVRMDAPSTLYYQCTSHALMAGVIHVLNEGSTVASIDNLSDVDTSTVAPTNGQALVWDSANSQWEPGTVSSGGGTTLPAVPTGGEVLASDGNQWTSLGLPALLEGGTTVPDLRLDFEGSGDTQTLLASGMTSTYPSTDAKFGSGGATFLRSNADYLQGTWPQAIGTQTFTLSFWIKTTDTDYSSSVGKRIIAPVSGTNLSNGFQLLREPAGGSYGSPHADNAQGAVMFNPRGQAAAYLCSTRTLDVADGAWHYIVFQHEGSGVYSCFADGSLTERRAATAAVDFGDNGGFFLGKRADNSANAYFTGSIDNLVLEIGSVLSTGSSVSVPTAPSGQGTNYGAGVSLDSLADVDTTTVAPTDGQALVWDNANSKWEPGTVSGGSVTSIDDIGDVDTSTVAPTDGQALVWDNANSKWEPGTAVTSIDDIGDVDTSTVAPTDGQALVWDNANSKWEPGTAVTSVNTQAGAVSLGIEDLDDFAFNTFSPTSTWTDPHTGTSNTPSNHFRIYSSGSARVSTTSSSGYEKDDLLTRLTVGTNIILTVNGTDHVGTVSADAILYNSGQSTELVRFGFSVTPAMSSTTSSDSALVLSYDPQPIALADGDMLQYQSAASKFRPAQLSVDNLSDVDTSTVAPTDGQALVWDNAAGKWEPGSIAGGVSSVNTLTGAVSLGIEDLDDFELNEASATSSVTRTPASSSTNNAASGYVGTLILGSGYTYWAYGPEGTSASNILTYLRDSSLTYPLDIDINGTTIAVQGINTDDGILRLDHSGFTNANQITGSDWTLSLASAPTEALANGDILQYNSTDSKFKPAQLPVTSVNTLTGAVSLGIEDLDDFELNRNQNLDYSTWSLLNSPTAGTWHINSQFFYLPKVDANGTDHSSNFRALDGTTTLVITQGGTTYNITNATLYIDELDDVKERAIITSGASAGGNIATIDSQITKSGAISLTCSSFSGADIALADGDILKYNSTDSKFKPAQLSVDNLSDVDTSTVAPTDGQALVWDNANSQWEPGTADGAVTSVNTQTGAVSLGVEDLDDFALNTGPQAVTFTNRVSSVLPAVDGDWDANDNSGGSIFKWASTGALHTEMLKLEVGDSVTFNFGSGDEVHTVSAAPAFNSSDAYFIRVTATTWTSTMPADGSSCTVTSTRFTPPDIALADGDILQYDFTDSKFKPASAPVSSVNTLTGAAISLGIEDLDDFALNTVTQTLTFGNRITDYSFSAGDWRADDDGGGALFKWGNTGAANTEMLKLEVGDTVTFNFGSGDEVHTVSQAYSFNNSTSWNIRVTATEWTSTMPAAGSSCTVTSTRFSPTVITLADGDILQYDSTDSKFKPAPLNADDLSDVDTSTVAPTDGQVLSWDNAASQWEPASLRTLLGIGEYVDDAAAGTGGLSTGELYYNTTSSSYVLKS